MLHRHTRAGFRHSARILNPSCSPRYVTRAPNGTRAGCSSPSQKTMPAKAPTACADEPIHRARPVPVPVPVRTSVLTTHLTRPTRPQPRFGEDARCPPHTTMPIRMALPFLLPARGLPVAHAGARAALQDCSADALRGLALCTRTYTPSQVTRALRGSLMHAQQLPMGPTLPTLPTHP